MIMLYITYFQWIFFVNKQKYEWKKCRWNQKGGFTYIQYMNTLYFCIAWRNCSGINLGRVTTVAPWLSGFNMPITIPATWTIGRTDKELPRTWNGINCSCLEKTGFIKCVFCFFTTTPIQFILISSYIIHDVPRVLLAIGINRRVAT